MKGLPLQSLYDITDDKGNTYIYTVQSESAHKVKFSDFGMNNIKDVKAFFSHLRQYKLYDLQGLQDFTNAMELGVSVDNTSDYLRVRKAFQEKFGIFMAFLDGNHRMTIAGLILGIIPITSDLNSDTYLDSYIDGIDIYKGKIQQTFTTWIQMDYNNSLLSADKMLDMSYQIKLMQDKTFGDDFSDIINMCKSFYDSAKQSHNETFTALNEENWLRIIWHKKVC